MANRVIYPENMLTWAISRKSIVTKVLLQCGDNFKKLPIEWKSNLCINVTTVGNACLCAKNFGYNYFLEITELIPEINNAVIFMVISLLY